MEDFTSKSVANPELLELMFVQLLRLPADKKPIARKAILLWEESKKMSMYSIIPDLLASKEYLKVYSALQSLGVEMGGLKEPSVKS